MATETEPETESEEATEAATADPSSDEKEARVAAATGSTRTARDWYAMGGATMHALVGCSVLILGLIFERAVGLRRGRFAPRRLERSIEESLHVGQIQEIKSLVERDSSFLACLARLALEGPRSRDRLEAEGAGAAHQAWRNLPTLAALGNLATMLGLLGTVLGMVEAFDLIARSGTGDVGVVASGIFRALVTTAAGLAIGIVALAAHAVFSRRAADLVASLEMRVSMLVDEVDRTRPGWCPASTVEIE